METTLLEGQLAPQICQAIKLMVPVVVEEENLITKKASETRGAQEKD